MLAIPKGTSIRGKKIVEQIWFRQLGDFNSNYSCQIDTSDLAETRISENLPAFKSQNLTFFLNFGARNGQGLFH